MSSYDDRNSGRDVPVLPRTGRLKRGATASEAQPQLKLSNTSSNGGPVSGFGPYRSASVGDNISHGRTSSLLHHQDVSRDPFHREPTQDEWHFSLPDSWSCQKNNSAGIVCDEFGLRLVSPGFGRTRKRTTAESAGEVSSRTLTGVSSRALDIIDVALVVANKPIPMVTLIRQADKRQAELAETHSLSTRALKAAAAASEPLSSPPTFSAAGANEKPSSPSRNESLGGGSIFPLKFVKPKRHKRKNSNEITDNGQIADLSSLVGMVAPKAHTCSGGGSYMGKTKTVKEIYDGLLSQNDVGANAGSVTNRMEESDRYTAPAIPYPAPKLELPSFVYYFEVTIMSGSAWVGLVAAENVVTHEQAHFMMGKSSSGDGSACYGGLLDAATTPNPFPILMHQIPGKSPESIGLGNNGELHIGGSMVGRDGKIVHSFTSHHGEPWAAPFVANNDGTSSGVFAGMGEGETVGCGWEIGGRRRVFFTHNGKVLHPERPIDGFDARGSAMFPSVGMETQGTNLVANFGLDPTTPLRFKGNAEFLPITLPITRAADKSIDEDPNTIEDADGQVPLSKSPSDVSNCTPAVIRSDYGDDHLRSAVVGDNNDRGAQTVRPGDEDSELEAVLKKSMDETSARVPDAEARPPITREGIEEAKVIARELRSLAENPEGADPLRLKSLLELCRSMQEHVVSTLQQESVSVDFESLFDLTGVLQHSIDSAKAAETEIRDLSQPGRGRMTSLDKAHDDIKEKIQSLHGSNGKDGEMSRSSPEVDELVRAKDFFSLLCLLRGHHNQRLASAYALMRFAKDEVIGGDEKSTSVRKEIQASGGMHSLLTLFRTSSNGQELKMVAALAVSYLLPCYTDPDGFLTGNLGLKVIACLRYIVYSSDSDYVEGLDPSSMRESAALALTHIWLNLEPFLSQKDLDDDQKGRLGSQSMVSERVPRSHRRTGPQAHAFSERISSLDPQKELAGAQKLLEQTVSLIVTVAEKLLPSRQCTRKHIETGSTSTYNITLAVESVCSVEPARSIAVREGLLSVLVQWLNSADNDLVAPAAKSMRFLATLNDSYMAGWIHSQIVNENALPSIVKLTESEQADVRRAVAEILASLSIAPHTRAAIIDNSGLEQLIQLLLNCSTADGTWNGQEPTTLAVGNALLQLSAGAMAYSNKWRRSPDAGHNHSERAGVIDALIARGAIEPLITMARGNGPSPLKRMSVEFLCIISAESRPRKYLCLSGAVEAFGLVLKQDVPKLYNSIKRRKAKVQNDDVMGDIIEESYSALLALANLLEPSSTSRSKRARSSLSEVPGSSSNMEVLRQTAESGGLEALLMLTTLPLPPLSPKIENSADTTTFDVSELGVESSRSLALLCPLLISDSASTAGLTHWAGDVLLALTNLLRRQTDGEERTGALREQQLDALRGLAYLAQYEPLRIRLVDGLAPQLLQMKSSRRSDGGISKAANQVCSNLGFRDDEIDLQCIGDDPRQAADWFSLERCLILQAMARGQVRNVLFEIWKDSLDEVASVTDIRGFSSTSVVGGMERILEDETERRLSLVHSAGDDDEKAKLLKQNLFKELGDDSDSLDFRRTMISQYNDIYGSRDTSSGSRADVTEPRAGSLEVPSSPFDDDSLSHTVAISSLSMADDSLSHGPVGRKGLLRSSPCSIIGSTVEREWVLKHQQSFDVDAVHVGGFCSLPNQSQELIQTVLPSKLLQNEVLPLNDFVPTSSFDFRALAMPERNYYSFRREGQVLSRVCEKHAGINESEDVFWTLSFTNSTFAGEYAESLVQALYRCPIIQSISFSERDPPIQVPTDNEDESGSTTLAHLAGTLPPWVTCLTFDNVLSNDAFSQLVAVFQTMGRLDLAAEGDVADGPSLSQQSSVAGAAFQFLAISNSPRLRHETFDLFYQLLGSQLRLEKDLGLKHASLPSLVALDLSGNLLGDDSVAALLSTIYDKGTRCSLERLDVSRNSIGRGDAVRRVLVDYVKNNPQSESGSWTSSLTWLGLASNNLHQGRLSIDLLEMLSNDALGLTALDLSDNNLDRCDGQDLLQVLLTSLQTNKQVCSLDLSSNVFSDASINSFIETSKTMKWPHRFAFLGLKGNKPPLSKIQIRGVKDFLARGKSERIKDYKEKRHQPAKGAVFAVRSSYATGRMPFVGEASLDTTSTAASVPSDGHILPSRDGSLSPLGGSSVVSVAAEPTPPPPPEEEEEKSVDTVPSERTPGLTGESIVAQRADVLHREVHTRASAIPVNNKITVLFSAPLVYEDVNIGLCPINSLDHELEREILWQVFKEASRDIDLSFDCATMKRLLAHMTVGCTCLHFSGHGHKSHLTFEDGRGGMHWLAVNILRDVISRNAQGGSAPFKFVFVSACHSLLAGETFVRAGVPHVVCCQQESQLMNSAALAFTRAFYLALAIGRTVRDSFEIGRQAVACSPSVPSPETEMKKFLLLPEGGDHEYAVFNAEAVQEWPRVKPESTDPHEMVGAASVPRRSSLMRRSVIKSSSRHVHAGGGSGIPTDHHLPSPPQGFLGREVDMYKLLNAVLEKRFVNLVGPVGMGRSSLAAALCHYVHDRKQDMNIDDIFYVRADEARRNHPLSAILVPLHKQLVTAGRTMPLPPSYDMDDVSSAVLKALQGKRSLVVLDRIEVIEESEGASELPLFLNNLFRPQQTKHVHVLMTAQNPLNLPSIGGVGEHVQELGPMNLKNTVKLFGISCRHVCTARERRKLEAMVSREEEDARAGDASLSTRSRDIFSRLGDGIPARIVDCAYHISEEEYHDMLAS